MNALAERLFDIFISDQFLLMRGLANEVPIFIQPYDPAKEGAVRQLVVNLTNRLRGQGVTVETCDLFELVLEELESDNLLQDLIDSESQVEKADLFETLRNYSDPETHLIPRLARTFGSGSTQLTLVTGPGRVYPFLRTHNILENLQPAMVSHPVVIFFPGEYIQDSNCGSQLRLFGSVISPEIMNPYYRAQNLDHYRI